MRSVSILGRTMGNVTLDPDGAMRLLSAILWELPSLPEAACRDRPELFDDRVPGETPEQRTQRLESAVAVCRHCPEMVVCEELPMPQGWHAVGVQAGRRMAPRTGGWTAE